MKKFVFFVLLTLFSAGIITAYADTSNDIYRNKFFSISVPKDLKGTYDIKTEKDKISIFHKDSKKAGFGGFAFGIKVYKSPADHAEMPGAKKLGELVDKKGNLYDVVIKYPTDVQHDYTKNPEAPLSYKLLYVLGEDVEIQGVKGAVYYKGQGTKGEDLYKDILQKHITAIKEDWDSIKLEEENMSPMYHSLAVSGEKVSDKIGYIYYDVNADGIDELLIGEITQDDRKGIIYDMYTMVNRNPRHVMSGWNRNRYFVCDNAFVCNDYSGGSNACGKRVYFLVENSTELFPQVSFKYDGYANHEKPWFLSYGSGEDDDKWENVSEELFNERKKVFEEYERFDFIPLSKAESKD